MKLMLTHTSRLLREARLNANVTQTELGTELGYIGAQAISNFERGSTLPFDMIFKAAKYLGVKVSELSETIMRDLRSSYTRAIR